MLELKLPSLALFQSFLAFSEDLNAQGEVLWEGYYPQHNEPPEQFVARLYRREAISEAPLVPETIYWGVNDGVVVGRISIRHRVEGQLLQIGGHVGYEVGPTHRRQGLATGMLKELLRTSVAQKIGNLLLTCAPENVASNKTIIANGGVLEQTIFVDLVKEYRNHYWIKL